jgi:AcrR family transcriptional regulator
MESPKTKRTNRKQSALKTEKTILETALRMFSSHGFENVTVDDIVKRAGLSKGSFYVYFKSKDEILVNQFKRIDDYYQEVSENVAPDTPAPEKLSLIGAAMCEYCMDIVGIDIVRVMYINQISHKHKVRFLNDRNRPLFRLLSDIVQSGLEKGELTNELSEDEIISIFTQSMRGQLYDWCLSNGKYDLKKTGRIFFARIILGISSV